MENIIKNEDGIAKDYQDLMQMNGVKILRVYDYLNNEDVRKEIKDSGYNMQSLSRKFNMTNEDAQVIFKYVCKFSKENDNENVCDILFSINEKMSNTTLSAPTKKRQKLIEEYTKDERLQSVLQLKFEESQQYLAKAELEEEENINLNNQDKLSEVEPVEEIEEPIVDKPKKSIKKYIVFTAIILIFFTLIMGAKFYLKNQMSQEHISKNNIIAKLPKPELNNKNKMIKNRNIFDDTTSTRDEVPHVDLSKLKDNTVNHSKDKEIVVKSVNTSKTIDKTIVNNNDKVENKISDSAIDDSKKETKQTIGELKTFNEIRKALRDGKIIINDDQTIRYKNKIYRNNENFQKKYLIQRITSSSIKLLNKKQKYSITIRR